MLEGRSGAQPGPAGQIRRPSRRICSLHSSGGLPFAAWSSRADPAAQPPDVWPAQPYVVVQIRRATGSAVCSLVQPGRSGGLVFVALWGAVLARSFVRWAVTLHVLVPYVEDPNTPEETFFDDFLISHKDSDKIIFERLQKEFDAACCSNWRYM
ncbi:hypothetical protein ZIOFF_023351 [Zingiber officinale]|uniref:Uncharacterized protein n=1 Tax=Zingiber officinale TaxID=94328 RepID=A0A8J5H0T7_ZINOF|nr:hypothetical protein ZIOFF_023351 [Zingiber officinale]